MDAADADVLDLRDYLAVLRRRWAVVAAVVSVTVAAALAVSLLQTPVYEGTAELAIEPVRQSDTAALEDLILGETVVQTERRVITSRPVTTRVIEELGLGDTSPSELVEEVSVNAVTETRIVEIVASDTDPEFAADLANAYADAYLDYRRDRALDEIAAARASLDERAQELRTEIADIEAELGDDADAPAGSLDPNDASLQARLTTLREQLTQVETQLAGLAPDSQAIRGGGEVLVPAEVEEQPVSPRPLRTGVLALVLGLMLGVGLAFLRDHFDDAIRTDEDIRRVGNGYPILGRVNHWSDPRYDERLITMVDPHDPASEEYRALSANVRFSLVGRHDSVDDPERYRQQSVLLTSATPGEGKTTTAANVAVASAAAGLRVILVEADLRKPTLSGRFGLPEGMGLSDLLVDPEMVSSTGRIAEHLLEVGLRGLRLLPAGTVPPNPTGLLASSRMRLLHETLTGIADLVVYDSPPVLSVADTLELARRTDLSLLVVRTGMCHRRALGHAVERLDGVGAAIGGFVVNDVTVGRRGGYGYGYGYRPARYEPRRPDDVPARRAMDWTRTRDNGRPARTRAQARRGR